MAAKELWTIGRLLKWTEQYFRDKGVGTPRLDAEVLLSYVLKKERLYLYIHFDEPLEANELASYRELIRRRVAPEPVAYIVGRREFMGLPFKVTPATLIPRPETEILAQTAIERLRPCQSNGTTPVIADIGTGSGAILLSALKFLPTAIGMAIDISPAAIEVAKENAASLGLGERVSFACGDLLSPLKDKEQQFAAILSNPPYIPTGDIANLMADVRCAEPHLALDGGADGLGFYRRLVAEAPAFLLPQGFLAVEVGIGQAAAITAMAAANPAWGRSTIVKDLADLDRVVVLEREAQTADGN